MNILNFISVTRLFLNLRYGSHFYRNFTSNLNIRLTFNQQTMKSNQWYFLIIFYNSTIKMLVNSIVCHIKMFS